jgi:hypothetical protein
MFKENMEFDYLKRELKVDDSFVQTAINESKKDVETIMQESIKKIHVHFDAINKKVKLLDDIKDDINLEF